MTQAHPTGTGSVIIVQPALPTYRVGLFRRMAETFGHRFTVYSSSQDELGLLNATDAAPWRRPLGPMRPLAPGLEWQNGALAIPVRKGDVLVISGAPRTLSTIALILKARLFGARVVWFGHYWSATSKAWRAALRLAIMQLADAVLFYTDQEVAEYLAHQNSKSKKPISAINNGVETETIEQLRAPYRSCERSRALLFLGRVTEKSQLATLLQALARPECESISLEVIGDGPSVESLSQLAAHLGLTGRIAWHGAVIDETRISQIANRCQAFVYPGSVGLSLIHGLAYGLPAIVHDDRWSHMPEIAAFKDGQNGAAFKKDDIPSLASTISTLLSDTSACDRMSSMAIKTITESFNTKDASRRFTSFIASLLEQR